ncbi:MAG: hypothetical protein ACI8QS_003594 [Planctomycetota bacterium]|jgi:hypothetical protein
MPRPTDLESALDLTNPNVARDVARLGSGARSALEAAAHHALHLHAEELTAEHLLSSMFLDESVGASRFVLFAFADPETLAIETLALSPGIMVIGSGRSLPFSVRGVRALVAARARAATAGAASVCPGDLLVCAMAELDPELQGVLGSVGLSLSSLDIDGPAAPDTRPEGVPLPAEGPLFQHFSQDARQTLGSASRAATQWNRKAISPAHLVFGALKADEILAEGLGLSSSRIRMALGGRDEDLTPIEHRLLGLDRPMQALLAALGDDAGTISILGYLLSNGSEEIRLLLQSQRITSELFERTQGSFVD